jgi:hypothetical protein
MTKGISSGLSQRRPWFDPSSVHVRIVVDKVALGQGFIRALLLSRVIIIPPTLRTHLHLHVALTRRTSGRSLKTLRKAMTFREKKGAAG